MYSRGDYTCPVGRHVFSRIQDKCKTSGCLKGARVAIQAHRYQAPQLSRGRHGARVQSSTAIQGLPRGHGKASRLDEFGIESAGTGPTARQRGVEVPHKADHGRGGEGDFAVWRRSRHRSRGGEESGIAAGDTAEWYCWRQVRLASALRPNGFAVGGGNGGRGAALQPGRLLSRSWRLLSLGGLSVGATFLSASFTTFRSV